MFNIKRIALIVLFMCVLPIFACAIEETPNVKAGQSAAEITAEKNETDIEASSLPENKDNKYVERALKHNKDYQKLKGSISLKKQADKKLISKISFDDILSKAKEHAYDLQIGEYNILIAKQGIRGARSEYFPKLVASVGTEYTKNFRDVKETTVMSIGDAFINPYTRYQSVMGVTLSYNLFDFGVRGGNYKIAKKEVTIQELQNEQKLQELTLTLIDTYAKILMTQKQIQINQEILNLSKINLGYKKRLFDAKEISKTELNDEEVRVSEVEKRIHELNQIYIESLNWLQFYTGEQYDSNNLKISDIKKPDFDVMSNNDYTKSVVWRVYDEQLKKKELELKVVQRMNYPKINAYGRYYLYGSDHSSYPRSFKDISPSNLTVGVNANMMLFDGLKNRANIHKTALEYKQLQVEREQAIAQLMTRLSIMRSNLIYIDKQIDDTNKMIDELSDKEVSVKRLVSKKLATPIDENEAKIKLLEQHIELEKNDITEKAIQKGIQVLVQ